MEAKFTIKNYRCFADSSPLKFNLNLEEKTFIALVGANNSGKSSFLKFFYELRSIWGNLKEQDHIRSLIKKTNRDYSYLSVSDPIEVFNDTNNRPFSIGIEIVPSDSKNNYLSYIEMISKRSNPQEWNITFYYNSSKIKINNQDANHMNNEIYLMGQKVSLDYSDFINLMDTLFNSFYIGAFRNAINQGSGSHYDLPIGTSFISTWNQWKTGAAKKQNTVIQNVTDDIARIFDFKSLQINYSDQLKTLQVIINNKPYRLDELGSGIAQFIVVLGNVAIKDISLILIDEPELNLHPSLQIDFLTSLASHAKQGIILATHSIGLARTTSRPIYSLHKKKDCVKFKKFTAMSNYAEFIGEMSFSAYNDMGFNKILLVEGVKDIKTLQQFLRLPQLRKDHKIVMIPLGGDQLANKGVGDELKDLTRITRDAKKIFCIVDSERASKNGLPSKARQGFAKVCKNLGFTLCMTERRAIENYFTEQAIQKIKESKYRALKPYEKLKSCNPSWSKTENWEIAREMKWNDIKNTDVGKFLKAL